MIHFLVDYAHVITDPAHIGAELTVEFASVLVGRLWLRRHDRTKHSTTHLETRIAALEAALERTAA